MSKYKVKPLEPQDRVFTYVWEGTGLSYHYRWAIEETDVTTSERGFSETIGNATTLEEAQAIVDEHHQKEIEALLDLVLEPEPPIEWQTGLVPEPTGHSIIYLECKSGKVESFKSYEFQDKWHYAFVKGGKIVDRNCTGRWYVQPANVPPTLI